MWWSALTGKLEQAKSLDPVADRVEKVVHTVLPRGPVKDALHGVWLGHPVHPLLVALPIGLWSGASLLDLGADRGRRRAARTLVGAGVLLVAPVAATGYADWSELGEFRRPRRVGLVHAAANVVTTVLYAASYLARRRGDHSQGARLALVGAGTLMVGGYLGGHLAFSQGVGVNRNADDARTPRDWTDAGSEDDLTAAGLHRVEVKGQPVLVTRQNGRLHAIGARCSHYGAPMEQGEVTEAGTPCVVCPWHGSVFSLTDGAVQRGPATAPLLAYDVRTDDGRVLVRARA